MDFVFPYDDDRLVGSISRVDGSTIALALPRARQLPRSNYGERVGLGEIGEFVLVDVGGDGILARLLELRTLDAEFTLGNQSADEMTPRIFGHAQLLCTVTREGNYVRGITRHPRIGDRAYTASNDLIEKGFSGNQ